MNYWLVKSEPFKYSWDQFVADGSTVWTGVRNYTARLNLRAMKKGDHVLFYHSNEGLEIVGLAKVIKEAYPDPTDEGDTWSVVDLKPVKKLKKPVTLASIKAELRLKDIQLLRLNRLSVISLTPDEFGMLIDMSQTKI